MHTTAWPQSDKFGNVSYMHPPSLAHDVEYVMQRGGLLQTVLLQISGKNEYNRSVSQNDKILTGAICAIPSKAFWAGTGYATSILVTSNTALVTRFSRTIIMIAKIGKRKR